MDENGISPIIYDAMVTAAEVSNKRHRIEIENVGEGWLTKKHWPNRYLPEGTKLKVNIVRDSNLERWLVSKIISINGEPYSRHNYRKFSGLDERYVRLGQNQEEVLIMDFSQQRKISFISGKRNHLWIYIRIQKVMKSFLTTRNQNFPAQ